MTELLIYSDRKVVPEKGSNDFSKLTVFLRF